MFHIHAPQVDAQDQSAGHVLLHNSMTLPGRAYGNLNKDGRDYILAWEI